MIPPELHRYQFILLCAENIPNHVRTEHSCLVSGHDVPAVSVIVVSSSIAYQRNIPFTEHHGSHEDVDSKCKRNGPLSREAVSRLVLVLASPESVQKNTRPFHTCTNRPIGHTSSNPGVYAIPLQEQTGVRLSVCRIGKLYLRNPLFIPAHKPFLLPLK